MSSIKQYGKQNTRLELRQKALRKWHVERAKILKKLNLVEKDEVCENCLKHLKVKIKLVEDRDAIYCPIYCPVCHRAVVVRDEFLYSTRSQKGMKKLETELKGGHRMMKETREWRINLIQVLSGSKCVRCGFDDRRALQLDHIRGDGTEDRKRFKNIQYMWRYYLDHPQEARKKLQVLCANCNWIKRYENDESPWNKKRNKGELEVHKNLKKYKEGLKKYKEKLHKR